MMLMMTMMMIIKMRMMMMLMLLMLMLMLLILMLLMMLMLVILMLPILITYHPATNRTLHPKLRNSDRPHHNKRCASCVWSISKTKRSIPSISSR